MIAARPSEWPDVQRRFRQLYIADPSGLPRRRIEWRFLEGGFRPAGFGYVGLFFFIAELIERKLIRRTTVWAANTCRDAVNELFRLGGASSIYEPGTLQRTWRDINVLNQHLFLRTMNHEHVAKLALGLEYDSPFL